jgi:hypothetical protein
MGIRTVSSMHQHPPSRPPVPQSNAVPQRAQARRRERNLESVCALIIVALLGVIAREINHPGVTGLRQPDFARGHASGIFFPGAGMARRHWPMPGSMIMMAAVLALNRTERIDDRPALLDHAEWS